MTPKDPVKSVRDVLEKLVGRDLTIKPNITPTHGSCCTCQKCGYHYDDCNCEARELVKNIDQALVDIRSAMPSDIEIQKAICCRCIQDGYSGECQGDDSTCKLMASDIRSLMLSKIQ